MGSGFFRLAYKWKVCDMSIKIRSAKDKGMRLQKWVCQKIAKILGIEYNSQDDQCLIHSRTCGLSGVDIILRGEAIKRFPYSIECKSSEKLNLLGTIRQAKSNQVDGTDWLIVYKRKAFKKPIVIMDWDAFQNLVEERNE